MTSRGSTGRGFRAWRINSASDLATTASGGGVISDGPSL